MNDKRNGAMDSMSKRDRKRQQINVRVAKHESSFVNERDQYYRSSVHEIQSVLVNLHRGNHEKLMMLRDNLEIERDYELTRLRLWEEYQVKQVEQEYLQDLVRAKENKERMIKLIKEKLYDKLQLQVKQLKEDKLLLNLVNANSWNSNDPTKAALNAAAMNLNEKRSLRKREISSRFTTGEADDLSDGGIGNGSATGTSGANISNGYISALKRRRHYATRYSSNDEMSSGINSSVTNNHSTRMSGISSGNDSNLSDKDYDELNSLIMHNEDGGASLMFSSENKSSGKPNTRGSHRQFVGVQGLKPEELQDDLDLLKSAITKK